MELNDQLEEDVKLLAGFKIGKALATLIEQYLDGLFSALPKS